MAKRPRRPRDKRTKRQLLADLTTVLVELRLSEQLCDKKSSKLATQEVRLMETQRQLAGANMMFDNTNKALNDSVFQLWKLDDEVQSLRENLRLAAEAVLAADSARISTSAKLYDEMKGREREQVLLKTLVATMEDLLVHESVEIVKIGAGKAGVNGEVALEVFDKYFRTGVLEKSAREGEKVPSSLAEMIGGGTGAEEKMLKAATDLGFASLVR